MNTETVLAHIVAGVTELLKQVVSQAESREAPPTLYDLEAQTQAVLAPVGQVILQALVAGQGAGVMGPERPCACGEHQRYQDQTRELTVQTSVGILSLTQRAVYQCPGCRARSYPLDEQLGLGQAGRMSRYMQEQCGWLLALLPARVAQQTLVRFGWPAVAASQIRKHGEALGAELEGQAQERLAVARQEAAGEPVKQTPERSLATEKRLYAAPDGVMYCTTERDQATGKVRWRELKVAAVYEARAGDAHIAQPAPDDLPGKGASHEPVRTRLRRWLCEQEPAELVAAPDQAVRVTYVAETGPWEQFGARLWLELWERGLICPGRELVVVADGSDHIDQVVDRELRIPEVHLTRILDIAHAQQHLWTVSKVAFGEGTAASVSWVQAPLQALEHGQVGEVVHHLETLAAEQHERTPAIADVARKAANYFRQRQSQVEYPRFVAAGYQIGSGLAESACKRFGTDRMKGAGRRWTVTGAHCVATLRVFVLSERWAEVSTHCRKAA